MTKHNPISEADTGLPSLLDLSDEISRARDFADLIGMAHSTSRDGTSTAAFQIVNILEGVMKGMKAHFATSKGAAI
jgi:hypothetical protein